MRVRKATLIVIHVMLTPTLGLNDCKIEALTPVIGGETVLSSSCAFLSPTNEGLQVELEELKGKHASLEARFAAFEQRVSESVALPPLPPSMPLPPASPPSPQPPPGPKLPPSSLVSLTEGSVIRSANDDNSGWHSGFSNPTTFGFDGVCVCP